MKNEKCESSQLTLATNNLVFMTVSEREFESGNKFWVDVIKVLHTTPMKYKQNYKTIRC